MLTGDLRGRDFAGQNLASVFFHDADLYKCRFDGADLTRAVFAGCFAAEASFERANCSHLRAIESNFYRGCFYGAALEEALFWNSVLAGADLRGARLKRVTVTLDCHSFEELRLDRAAGAELAYLFGRARSPHRPGWLDVVGERDLVWLDRVFAH